MVGARGEKQSVDGDEGGEIVVGTAHVEDLMGQTGGVLVKLRGGNVGFGEEDKVDDGRGWASVAKGGEDGVRR
jgi:hypothetical protein